MIRSISSWMSAAALVGFQMLTPSLSQAQPAASASASASASAPTPSASDSGASIWSQAMASAKEGLITLKDQATLKLPADLVFIEKAPADALLKAMGNPGDNPNLEGIITPKGDENWFIVVTYNDSGYIKDGDAKEWNADDLLKSYREGTEESNVERRKMGVSELEITGWAEKPQYDAANHRLVWAMISKDKGQSSTDDLGVNYNTYVLGREGYYSMNLVTALKTLPKDKTYASAVISAVNFNDGKRYADFNEKTDRVAEYGLAALVLGVGAKKLGFIGLAAAFLAKFAKLIVVGVVGAGYALKKRMGKNDENTTA